MCGGSEAVQLRLCHQEQPGPQLHKQRLRLRLPAQATHAAARIVEMKCVSMDFGANAVKILQQLTNFA